MPLGDITATIHTLIVFNETTDFLYTYQYKDRQFILDTRQMRKIIGDDISFAEKEISVFIKEYLQVNKEETDDGADI